LNTTEKLSLGSPSICLAIFLDAFLSLYIQCSHITIIPITNSNERILSYRWALIGSEYGYSAKQNELIKRTISPDAIILLRIFMMGYPFFPEFNFLASSTSNERKQNR
jgi:hypothetical protein